MKWKAVIFDLDGTLIDSMGIWQEVDYDFLLKRGIQAPENLFDDVKAGNSFSEIALHFKEKFQLPESPEEIMHEWTEMVKEKYMFSVKLKPFVLETLQYLQAKKIKIGIGTSNTMALTKMALQLNQVENFFDVIVYGNDSIKGKPYPDIFLEAANQMDVLPEKCVVIEDVFVGVQAAQNANMKVIAIEDEFSLRDRKKIEQTADFYAQNFHEIKAILSSHL
jgi:HAD superfamily hydrolase (TIGR01509 family)